MIEGRTILCFASGYDAPPTSKHNVVHRIGQRSEALAERQATKYGRTPCLAIEAQNQETGGRRPKVVQLTAFGSTVRLFLKNTLRILRESGFDVTLACSGDGLGEAVARETGVAYTSVTIRGGISPISDLKSVLRLWCLFRHIRPDVVHAHMSKAGLVGMLAAWLARVPLRLYHNHGLPMLSYHGMKRLVFLAAERLTITLATHVLFVSKSCRIASLGLDCGNTTKASVLYNGVNVNQFARDPTGMRRALQRNTWGVKAETVVVGFVGRINRQKGVGDLLMAWRLLPRHLRVKARLVLVGSFVDDQIKRSVEQAAAAGLGVQHVGWMTDTVSAYEAMDIFVLPSWHEGLAVSLLEAASMELPVITTSTVGCLDAVENEVTGVTVPLRCPSALAKAMARLINSPEERQYFGENGRKRACSQFSLEMQIRSLLDFYHALLQCPNSGSLAKRMNDGA